MKRILSVILALTLALSLCLIPASAQGIIHLSDEQASQKISMNDDSVDLRIVYGCTMTETQQKQYDNGSWAAKTALLQECYAVSKDALLKAIGAVCEYQVLRDTSINQIFMRVPSSAVDTIQQLKLVKSIRYDTLPVSKLNDQAQKLITEADPRQAVHVTVSTERGDVAAMRDYFNVSKQEMNAYFQIEDENGVNEWVRASQAYYTDYHRQILNEITKMTSAVYQPYSMICGDETITDLDISCWARFFVPVGQIETLAQIDGITAITYEPPKGPDPFENWYFMSGDLDLLRKLVGEPNEYGMFYIPQELSLSMTEEEYARYKAIEYVQGVTYCRPAPSDGWWRLEGDPALLKATYGAPDADGRYYVPKKAPVMGDVDYDDTLTVLDATGIQRELADLGAEHFNATVADYDEDGYMTILDATGIQRTLADIR